MCEKGYVASLAPDLTVTLCPFRSKAAIHAALHSDDSKDIDQHLPAVGYRFSGE